MIHFKLEKPDLWKVSEERKKYIEDQAYALYFRYNLWKYCWKEYLYWDKIRYKDFPKELHSVEELWLVIQRYRKYYKSTTIINNNWAHFKLDSPDFIEELTHNLDLNLGWKFLNIDFSESERRMFLQNGIAEEAISSSQIEWAMTSSKVAKEMIQQWRKPMSKDEKMIINNYNTMQFINTDFKEEKLTVSWFIELQKMLTLWTLEEENQIWRLRKDQDQIVVKNSSWTKILHEPMNEWKMKEELSRLIEFANDEETGFTHPFIKAVMLHFWIGYLHPFCDGNGRTARAVFYWYLIKKWYWGFSFIPVSKAINDSKIQYWKSYLYSEQDGSDMTYFLVYIANKVIQSMDEFHDYVENKIKKQKVAKSELSHLQLNDRQKKLIAYFLENSKSYTNNTIHKNYNSIAMNTANTDLKDLLKRGFVYIEKQGKFVNYFPVNDLKDRI